MKQPYASDSSVVMKDKLPEWPEKESFDMGIYSEERHYYAELAEAALARMEALAALLADVDQCIGQGPAAVCHGLDGRTWFERRTELLAACDRGAATQSGGAGRKEAGR